MAIPLILRVPATGRAALPFIRAGVRRGLSDRAIERVIKKAGLPISRGRSIAPLAAAEREILAHAQRLRFVNKQATIDALALPPALTDIGERFSFTFRVTGRDPFGRLVEHNTTVLTNNIRPVMQDLEDEAFANVAEGGRSDTLVQPTVVLESGIQNVGGLPSFPTDI